MYKVDCQHCHEFYVGMTCRRLEQRLSEHSKDLNSALFKHGELTGHSVDFNNVDILDTDSIKIRILIKETLSI